MTDYESALTYLETLMDSEAGTPEEQDMELFAVLIENFEKEHFPIALPDPIEAIKFRMEQQGLTRKDLVPFIGSQSKVSEVLNGKRPLSISMIRALEKGLKIPAKILLQTPGEDEEDTDENQSFYQINPLLKEEEFSVEITVKSTKDLQRQLALNANRAGASLDEYIITALETFAREGKSPFTEQKAVDRIYPGLSTAALQVMITSGLQNEANRSDEQLLGHWLMQKIDEIQKNYTDNEFEKCSAIVNNALACLIDSSSESPIIEGLVRILQFQKNLFPSFFTETSEQFTTPEKLQSQINAMIGQVNISQQKFTINYAEPTTSPESTLAEDQFKKTMEQKLNWSAK